MTSRRFEFSIERRPGAIDVVLGGDVDMDAVFKLEPALDAVEHDLQDTDVVFDLRPATFIDSSGLGVLVSAYDRLTERGARARFVRGVPEVMQAFTISGLDEALPFEDRGQSGQGGSPGDRS